MAKKKISNTKPEKSLDKALKDVLSMPNVYTYDVRDEAEMRDSDEQSEPMDKVLITIQHLLINQEWEKASRLINKYRYGRKKGTFFSYHHLNQLIEWVRSIYKHTDIRDLSANYYNYSIKQEIPGVKDLKSINVKEEHVERLVKDLEKVLSKKLEMR